MARVDIIMIPYLNTKRAKRATASHPKFYFFDTGLYSVLRPSGPLDRAEERAGEALEGLAGQHLRAWIDYRHPGVQLFYWRTSAGSEVDFILYGDEKCKNSDFVELFCAIVIARSYGPNL